MENGFRFPIFIDVRGKKAIIVGGGEVACRRAAALAQFGARVTLVAPRCPQVPEGVRRLGRSYVPGDIEGAFLAVAATDDREVNRLVGEEARALDIPVSVADAPEECTFFFPAVCVGKNVVAGVASRGGDHALTARAAQAIRGTLEEVE